MSKLRQLCSYLERPDTIALTFVVGEPAIVKSSTRDLPVTVAPLSARNLQRFFEGTVVAPLLVGGDLDQKVDLDVEGEMFKCRVIKRGTQSKVSIKRRTDEVSIKTVRVSKRRITPIPHERSPSGTDYSSKSQRRPTPVPDHSQRSPTPVPSRSQRRPTPVPDHSSATDHLRVPHAQPEPAPAPPPPPVQGLGAKLAPRRITPRGTPRVDAMLRQMVDMGASDLHLSSQSTPMVRLHGKMQPLSGQSKLDANELSSLLLEIVDDNAYRDFVENADADFAHSIKGVARFRANYFADRKGMGAVFRQIPMDILQPEAIGLPPKVLDLCWLSKGLVLVTGPTGSGKSTTLASMIDFINRNRDDHVITIEDPIEFVHDNKRCLINQREVGRHTRSFKAALRAALREDPDVVLVGELRDLETIAIAIETAETGHLVFGTLHTTTAPSTVDRLIDQFPGDTQAQIRTMLGESLRGVIGQTLLRRKKGGRVAAYEVLLHTNAVGNLIREGKTHQLKNTMQVSKHIGMQNLNDHLCQLVLDDVVEPREAYVKAVDKHNLLQMFGKAGVAFQANDIE